VWPEAGLDTHMKKSPSRYSSLADSGHGVVVVIVLLGNQATTQFIVTMTTKLSRLLFNSIWKQEIATKKCKIARTSITRNVLFH
jgi:hypothetical protein